MDKCIPYTPASSGYKDRDEINPHLVELVRLLARQAARAHLSDLQNNQAAGSSKNNTSTIRDKDHD